MAPRALRPHPSDGSCRRHPKCSNAGSSIMRTAPRCDESRPVDRKQLVRMGNGGCYSPDAGWSARSAARPSLAESDTQGPACEAMARRGRSVYTPIDRGYAHGRNACRKRILWTDDTRVVRSVFVDLCRRFRACRVGYWQAIFRLQDHRRDGISCRSSLPVTFQTLRHTQRRMERDSKQGEIKRCLGRSGTGQI